MKEIINTIGTIVTVVALVIAIVMIPSAFVKVLAGIGVVYVMYFHDEYVKNIGRQEAIQEFTKPPESSDIPKELID